MDRDHTTLHQILQTRLDPVAQIMRLRDAQSPRNHQVKFDKGGGTSGAGAQIMRLNRADGLGCDDAADFRQDIIGQGFVQQA